MDDRERAVCERVVAHMRDNMRKVLFSVLRADKSARKSGQTPAAKRLAVHRRDREAERLAEWYAAVIEEKEKLAETAAA